MRNISIISLLVIHSCNETYRIELTLVNPIVKLKFIFEVYSQNQAHKSILPNQCTLMFGFLISSFVLLHKFASSRTKGVIRASASFALL